MPIKPTLNIKITLNVTCQCQQNQEKCPAQHYLYFEHIFREMGLFLSECAFFKDQKITFIRDMRKYA